MGLLTDRAQPSPKYAITSVIAPNRVLGHSWPRLVAEPLTRKWRSPWATGDCSRETLGPYGLKPEDKLRIAP
jgi:hypothetical protein